jgi:hypothetical protein
MVMAVFLEPFRAQERVDEITENEERHRAAEDEIEHGDASQTVAGEDVEDGHREGADSDGDHENVEHGVAFSWVRSSRLSSVSWQGRSLKQVWIRYG